MPLNLAARARFWLVRTLPGVVFESHGSILDAKMVVFSKLLRAHARAKRTCCYLAETPLKLMFRAHQSCCATRRGSCKIVKIRSASLSASLFAKVALQNRSERSSRGSWSVSWATRESFLTTPGRSWPTRGVPRSALGLHLGVEQPSQARPDAIPNQLWTYEFAQN